MLLGYPAVHRITGVFLSAYPATRFLPQQLTIPHASRQEAAFSLESPMSDYSNLKNEIVRLKAYIAELEAKLKPAKKKK